MSKLDFTRGLEQAWTEFATFMPKLLLALVILVVGYIIAKLLAKLLDSVLERLGFDSLVERGGVKRLLERTKYDASDLLAKVVYYGVMLLVLQFAFGIFGPNAVSSMLTDMIAFLPKLFAALLIVIVASAVASAVKDILGATLAGLSYGPFLAKLTAAFIVATSCFAALSQIEIAPAIVNGLYYACLAVIVGSAIVAIGGGGIAPMRVRWEKALNRLEQETPGSGVEAANRARQQQTPMPASKQP